MIIMRPRAADYIAPPGFCPLHDTLRNEPPKMSEPVLYLLSVATHSGRIRVCWITNASVYPRFSRVTNITVVELSLRDIYNRLIKADVQGVLTRESTRKIILMTIKICALIKLFNIKIFNALYNSIRNNK